ncbi:MAG: hypothetical protein NC203_05700 [Firmicutes bacterium]|nr:hypothetical protein [[Eubacterium] siraeum]MCM1487846.1 hypothetical protein [Bacillota bacterium]
MKKIKCSLLSLALLMTSITSTACSDSAFSVGEDIVMKHHEERIEYNIDDAHQIKLYDGNLYAIPMDYDEEALEMKEARVRVFDDSGEEIREIILKDIYNLACFDISDDVIYLVVEDTGLSEETDEWGHTVDLYSADINTGETERLYSFPGLADKFYAMSKIRVTGDKVYWLGVKDDYASFSDTVQLKSDYSVGFTYGGYAVGCYDMSSGENTVSNIPYPVSFSERNGKAVVYGYEKDVGYCFYDFTDESVLCSTNKLYGMTDFELINDDLDFVFTANNYNDTLSFSGLDDTSGVIQLDDNLTVTNVSAEGEHVCVTSYVNAFSNKVYKYSADVSTADPPIRVITSLADNLINPLFGCGYQIKTDMLEDDDFVLTVLSLDKSYDLVMVDTNSTYSSNIRNKGSFYPLNDVPGVKEYIDSCFPFIQEAATDENGDIWMLPVDTSALAFVYNQKNCEDIGITFPKDIEKFFGETENISGYYDCFKYYLLYSLLNSYLAENDSFNTDTFRQLAAVIRENNSAEIFNGDNGLLTSALNFHKTNALSEIKIPGSSYYEDVYEKMLFTTVNELSLQQDLVGDENLLAAAMPSVSEKNIATCMFICVNPYSEHLEEALLFIERMASRLANTENSFALTDKSTYSGDSYTQSLYSIYENAEITFNIPWDIYYGDFLNYMEGNTELEDFIAEADRKLSAYLNE